MCYCTFTLWLCNKRVHLLPGFEIREYLTPSLVWESVHLLPRKNNYLEPCYCVSNAVNYAKKKDVLPTILSTASRDQYNRFLHWTYLDQYLPYFFFIFYFLSIWSKAALMQYWVTHKHETSTPRFLARLRQFSNKYKTNFQYKRYAGVTVLNAA